MDTNAQKYTMKGLNAFKIHVFFFNNHINLTICFETSNSASLLPCLKRYFYRSVEGRNTGWNGGAEGIKTFRRKNQQNREKFKGNRKFSLKTLSAAQKGVGG